MLTLHGVHPLFISFDGVRWFGLDVVILVATVVVIWLVWQAHLGGRANASGRTRAFPGGSVGRGAIRSTTTSAAMTIAGIGLISAGAWSMSSTQAAGAPLLLIVAGAFLAASTLVRGLETVGLPVSMAANAVARWWMFLIPGLLTLAVWNVTSGRPQSDSRTDLVLPWLAAIASYVVVAGWSWRPDWAKASAELRSRGPELALLAGVILVAAVARLWNRAEYPWTMSGDEGIFALNGVRAADGLLGNPFGSGWYSHPTMFFYLNGLAIRFFGNSVDGVRVTVGVLGVLSVLCIYGYGRCVWGPTAGLIAGSIAAVFHFHLYFSRYALNNITDALLWPLALLLLDRGILARSRLESALAGVAIGFGIYAFFGSRILPVVAALFVLYAFLSDVVGRREGVAASLRSLAPCVLLMAGGYLVVAAPFLAYLLDFPEDATARMRSVSVFSPGWLESQQEVFGKGTGQVLWDQFRNAALMPISGMIHGHYRPAQPFIGSALVIPFAIGTVVVTVFAFRRHTFGIAAAYWSCIVAVALTLGVVESNRFVIAASLIPLVAAAGIESVRRWVAGFGKVARYAALGVTIAVVVIIGQSNLRFYFSAPNEPTRYSDNSSQVANFLGYELRDIGPGVTYYFSASPRMSTTTHPNLTFLAPDAVGIDVIDPWTPDMPPPEIVGTTLFVILPERMDELAVVQSWFPDAETHIVYGTYGEKLYYVVRVEAFPGGTG